MNLWQILPMALLGLTTPLSSQIGGGVEDGLELPWNTATGGFGKAIDSIGDLDGDGVPDLLVGAPDAVVNGVYGAGAAFAFSGRTGFTLLRLEGEAIVDSFGLAVAGMGDLNGDGIEDLAISAKSSSQGFVYLLSGADGTLLRRISSPPGELSFGSSLERAGDVNGDGVEDVLIGIPYHGPPRWAGAAVLYSGADGTPMRMYSGTTSFQEFGFVLANAGDLDGDGVDDHVVGAPGTGVVGGVFVYSGATGVELFSLLGPSGWGTNSLFGAVLDAGKDVDGDGIGDLLITAYNYTGLGWLGSGWAYLYSGVNGHLLLDYYPTHDGQSMGRSASLLDDVSGNGLADVVFSSEAYEPVQVFEGITGAFLFDTGTYGRVHGAPDINGDGLGDFIEAQSWANQVKVLSGNSAQLLYSLPVSQEPSPYFGTAVARIEDQNQDGVADILIGDPGVTVAGVTGVGMVQLRSG
jgi:hypothetical protein